MSSVIFDYTLFDTPSRFGGWARGRLRAASASSGGGARRKRAIVYVDGFNLYLKTIEGHFLSIPAWMHLVHPPPKGPSKVEVIKTEEKGSDVNLATHLIVDAFDRAFDVAVVVLDDSDLSLPIEIVCKRFRREVVMLAPLARRKRKKASRELIRASTSWKPIRDGPLSASQFPPTLSDTNGTIKKPQGW